MKAIISDIHGNLEALTAVLADITAHQVDSIYCLGDLVGYGPNPRECVDLIMDCDVVLLGNHDQYAIEKQIPDEVAAYPQEKLDWILAELSLPDPEENQANRRMKFLNSLPRQHRENETLYVHGSPRTPTTEYIFPEDIYNERKMQRNFDLVDRLCFNGHTHVPGIFTEQLEFFSPVEVDYSYQLGTEKVICNVGAVSDPRDGINQASYVLWDGETILFRRIDSDNETTKRKLRDLDGDDGPVNMA